MLLQAARLFKMLDVTLVQETQAIGGVRQTTANVICNLAVIVAKARTKQGKGRGEAEWRANQQTSKPASE